MSDPLGLYVIRCQRNAFWAVLPLMTLAAFAAVVMRSSTLRQGTVDQYMALLPVALAFVALTYRLAANSADLLQRAVAVCAAFAGMTAFALGLLWPLQSQDMSRVLLHELAAAGVCLLAAALIPCRPREDGGLAWWRIVVILGIAFAAPLALAVEHASGVQETLGAVGLAAPFALALATARCRRPLPMIVVAAGLGAVVGAAIDVQTPLPAVVTWTLEVALLYAIVAAAVHAASRARGMTAVRSLDGVPVRVPPWWRWAPPRVVVAAVAGGALLLALAGRAFVARSEMPSAAGPGGPRAAVGQSRGRRDRRGESGGPLRARRPSNGGRLARECRVAANEGIESVFETLTPKERAFAGDADSRPLEGDSDGDGRTELLDPWGNPLVYFHWTAYNGDSFARVPIVRRDGTVVEAHPNREHLRPSFTLFSMGPDQLPNTGDDVDYAR